MNYWLIKSEPEEYSFDDLLKDGSTQWTGVRNYAARIHLRNMRSNDRCFFYHSVNDREIVGIARISKEAYPDPTFEGSIDWVAVDVIPVKKLNKKVSLGQLKADKQFEDLELIRISRLSVSPVSEKHWKAILKLADTKDVN